MALRIIAFLLGVPCGSVGAVNPATVLQLEDGSTVLHLEDGTTPLNLE